MSPRLPPKISFKDNWMKELDSEVAGSSKDSQRIQPKSETQLSRTERPVSEQPSGSFTQEIGKDVLFGREGTKNSRTVRPVYSCVPVSVELVDRDEDADENVDADQTRTETPVGGQQSTQVEDLDINFRVPGLSHAVVKEAENFRVRELVKKIESHPHREALHADLQQNNVYNPFSNNSKAMIRELWNVESRRKFNKLRLDALFIPHYVMKKERHHGARHGKTEEQKEY